MKLQERLETLATEHEEMARAIRLTMKALRNGAVEDAQADLPKKLAKAVKLRQARNGHGATAAPAEEQMAITPRTPGVRYGSEAHRLVAWLKDREPQTTDAINTYLGTRFSIDNIVKRGIVVADRKARPFTYTVTAKGRAALAYIATVPRNKTRDAQRRKEKRTAGTAKGAVLQRLRAAMQDKGPFTRASLNSLLKAEGISWQGVSAASRYHHVTISGPKQDRRFEWVSA